MSRPLCVLLCCLMTTAIPGQTLPGTKPLKMKGDIASTMVDGIDKFLLRQIDESVAGRKKYWQRDYASKDGYAASIMPNRKRLAEILGVRDKRHQVTALRFEASTQQSHLVGESSEVKIFAVQWPVMREITGRGLLLVPKGNVVAHVIAIPDADQTPEAISGLDSKLPPAAQFARRLAASGCQVLVPTLIDRTEERRKGRSNLNSREYLHRSGFELGRHLVGYEVQKVLAGIDWFAHQFKASKPIGVFGYGEGAMISFYTGALDERVQVTGVSGYFGSRQRIWDEPLERNVFGLLEQFGDAEIATMIQPRKLVVEVCDGPVVELKGGGGAPSMIQARSGVDAEMKRTLELTKAAPADWPQVSFVKSDQFGSAAALDSFLGSLAKVKSVKGEPIKNLRTKFDPKKRQSQQMGEIDRHNQWLLSEGPFIRKKFMSKLDTSSLAAYERSVEEYRKIFRHEVVGHFDIKPLPANPRTRLVYEKPGWKGYEVVLDVFPDVIAFGVLLVPNDIKKGEKRPVVVCQHGLEGRPKDVIEGDHRAYHDFAAKLAERGFVTFAPQNIYIFRDRFRTLQRKAYPLKKTLFSIMVPQHQQIVDWLEELPFVDKDRIAFYGLSYGGKSAMRIPPLVTDYCLSICSADFNEWVRKNASTQHPFSYVWTGEYEIFEWDLGSTFNYAEMAALICPRPFMVERGHYDGVGWDEWVAYEFAKVRHLYAAKLNLADRCEIEWFYGKYKGIHTINGQGTFDFLHRHLRWPKPDSP